MVQLLRVFNNTDAEITRIFSATVAIANVLAIATCAEGLL